ncbi:AraC family transcriptional regulator [Paenibacillus swuensis]|uniref:AraC family transcriptional regulator n=1 Tax=Paenibacillus swuensis TaxID=1178515 RepID=A0A172TKZ9_9BACL|nr:AraC family transcriptional regulator [Paenibacillus swuensis]ANE47711.1 AraC family transcriptional regulator [Paenibacillus swuensis]
MSGFMKEEANEFLENHYFIPSSFEKSGGAWPLRIGTNVVKTHYHIGPRTSPYYFLMFVLEGTGMFHQGGGSYPLKSGDLFCLFPQVVHEYYTDPHDTLKKIWFAFDGKQALDLLKRIGLVPHRPFLPGGANVDAIHLMQEFLQASRVRGACTDLNRMVYFLRVFDCLSNPSNNGLDAMVSSTSWLERGRDYMEIHYAEGITIQEMAAYAGVDRTTFAKKFKQIYGISPVQYLQKLRIEQSKLLLKETQYKLSEIAESVGYADLFTFSKAFKKFVGIAPLSYRKL